MYEIRSNHRKDTKISSEASVYSKLESSGFQVIRRGWPDCAAYNEATGELRFIEVKPGYERLRAKQEQMREVFQLAGIKYEVWHVRNSPMGVLEYFADGEKVSDL